MPLLDVVLPLHKLSVGQMWLAFHSFFRTSLDIISSRQLSSTLLQSPVWCPWSIIPPTPLHPPGTSLYLSLYSSFFPILLSTLSIPEVGNVLFTIILGMGSETQKKFNKCLRTYWLSLKCSDLGVTQNYVTLNYWPPLSLL